MTLPPPPLELELLRTIERQNTEDHRLLFTPKAAMRIAIYRRAVRTCGFWNEFGPPVIDGHLRPSVNPDTLHVYTRSKDQTPDS